MLEILNKGEIQVGDKERHAELDRMHTEVIDIVAGKLVDPKTKRVYTTGMIEKALDILSKQGAQADGAKTDSKAGSGAASGTATPASTAAKNGDVAEDGKVRKHGWTGVVTTKSAKSQALEAMKALIEHQPIPVQRARMRLRVTCPAASLKQVVKTKATGEEGETAKSGTVKDRILASFEQVEAQDVMGDEWEATGFAEPGVLKTLGDFLTTETKGRGRVEVLDMAVVHEGE